MKGIGDYISREAALLSLTPIIKRASERNRNILSAVKQCADAINWCHAADVRPVPEGGIGEMSDGYHTFNGLYYQRMVLFAALVIAHNDKAWKSWKHEDGEPCFGGGWFIVGIDTPKGSYTYHYEDKYWNWFECEELPVAKHWDGHTEEDVTRLLSLDMPRWIPVTDALPEAQKEVIVCDKMPNGIRYVTTAWIREDCAFWNDCGKLYEVTHWMPLPEPPKEE